MLHSNLPAVETCWWYNKRPAQSKIKDFIERDIYTILANSLKNLQKELQRTYVWIAQLPYIGFKVTNRNGSKLYLAELLRSTWTKASLDNIAQQRTTLRKLAVEDLTIWIPSGFMDQINWHTKKIDQNTLSLQTCKTFKQNAKQRSNWN